jgi:outer membrane protein TolC
VHAAAPGDVVRLDDLLAIALQRSPKLHAARRMAEATKTRESGASLPPDPQLQFGVMNIALPSLSASMPSAMAPSIQAMQMLPLGGKLARSGEIAKQETAIAAAMSDEVWLGVRTAVGTAFYEIYEVDRQIGVVRETLTLLRHYESVARAMYAAANGRQTDVLRAGVEIARMDAELKKMSAMRDVAAAMLNAQLDRSAAMPIAPTALPALPADLPAADTLLTWADASRPALERERIAVQQAATRGQLMKSEIWPDISIGVAYGQRPSDMGTERMGSVMLGFSVPVFAARRQLRLRDEAAAMQHAAESELAGMRAMVDAEIRQSLAELDRARTLLRLYRDDILPQADATVQSALSSYRIAAVDFMTLIDAQISANEYRTEYHGLAADYGRAVLRLEAAVGRELPVTTRLALETR